MHRGDNLVDDDDDDDDDSDDSKDDDDSGSVTAKGFITDLFPTIME